MYQFKNLKKFINVVQGVSEVKDGNMQVFKDLKAHANLGKLLKNNVFKNFNEDKIIYSENVRGNSIKRIFKGEGGSIKMGVDGIVTNERGVLLAVPTADCLPVLFYDPAKKAVAAVHAGFPGVAKRILPKAVDFFKKEFKSKTSDIVVGIGPHISQKNYEIYGEWLDLVKKDKELMESLSVDNKFSLKDAAIWQLTKEGILSENIEVMDICTYGKPGLFFSYRYQKANPDFYREKENAFVTIIGLK